MDARIPKKIRIAKKVESRKDLIYEVSSNWVARGAVIVIFVLRVKLSTIVVAYSSIP
jgi:hypothetical protein